MLVMYILDDDELVKELSFRGHSYRYDNSHWQQRGMFEEWKDEQKCREWLFDSLASDDVFIDIGSCHGSWSIPAAAVGARVYAFDMKKQGLPSNLELNPELKNRITFFEELLWSSSDLSVLPGPRVWEYRVIHGGQLNSSITSNGVKIKYTKTLDSHKIKNVKFMKIDVEGAEAEVVEGAKDTISKYRPKMMVECHDEATTEKLFKIINDLGKNYDIKKEIDNPKELLGNFYFS